MPWLLDLNDTQLSLYEGLHAHYQEPGICLWHENRWLFGQAAWEQSRLNPQQANSLYLSRLSAEPLPRALGDAQLHADLVYQQLLDVRQNAQPDCVTVAVSGNTSNEQLGVLLGIAKEAKLPIERFCDAAVLALVQAPLSAEETWVLDIALHGLVLTCVKYSADKSDVARGTLQRTNVEVVNGAGLANLIDGWINVAADEFVKATRFDPLHAAATEQQLHNQVLHWLQNEKKPSEMPVVIDLDGNQRRIDINGRLFADKTQQRAEALANRLPPDAAVAVTARAAAVPGLLELLANRSVHKLPGAAVAEGFLALRAADELAKSDGVVFVSAATHLGNSQTSHTPTQVDVAPTHGLHRDTAIPLAKLLVKFNYNRRGRWLHLPEAANVLVNGSPPNADLALSCGDTLSVHARQYQLIHVQSDTPASDPGANG